MQPGGVCTATTSARTALAVMTGADYAGCDEGGGLATGEILL